MFGDITAVSTTAEGEDRRSASVLRDRYVLETRLEQGRLGTVHRATDRLRSHAGRQHVAILILPTEISADPARLDAFRAGFEAVRELSHPNIVELYDLERDGDTHFVVLEWVDGETLRSVIDTLAPETVCEADALGVVRAVGSALIYAHAKGIVHGDVRPENVIVTEHGEVVLLFTPACLAHGAPFTVTPRDDVRGLAALLYELMAGTPPPAGGLYEGAKDEEPRPIDELGRKRWKALRRALSLRDSRIATVRQLLAALDLEPAAVSGRPRRKGYRAVGRRTSGIGRRVAMLAALGAAAAAVVGAYRYGAARAPEAVDLATWSSELSSRFDRAASLTRSTLGEARSGLARATGAVAAYLERAETNVPPGTSETNAPPAASDANAPRTASDINEPSAGAGSEASAPPSAPGDARESASAENESATPSDGADAAAATEETRREPSGSDSELASSEDSAAADARAASAAENAPETDASPSDAADRTVGGPAVPANDGDSRDRSGSAEDDAALEPAAVDARSEEGAPAAADDSAAARDARAASEDARAAAREDRGAAPRPEPEAATAVYFTTSEVSVSESGGVAAIRVTRTTSRGTLPFVWWTRDGSAVAGEDYADLGRVVEQFGEGETMRTLYVPIVSDAVPEPRSEHFEVLVGALSPEGNQDGAIESVRVTIVDDD